MLHRGEKLRSLQSSRLTAWLPTQFEEVGKLYLIQDKYGVKNLPYHGQIHTKESSEMAAIRADLYVAPAEWKQTYTQCIAPTAKEGNPRCRNSNGMSADDKNTFLQLLDQSSRGPRRQRAIIRFIAHLCCANTNHRKIVQHDVGDIQRALVARYDHRVELASSTVVALASSTAVKYFVPYRPLEDSPRTVLEELQFAKQNLRLPRRGFVYVFSWPDHPGYIKIGYTGGSVEKRVTTQDCYPSRVVLNQFEFAYPERIEQLVHRELGKYRYEIMSCDTCKKNHTEWFKISANEATRVIAAWHTLVQTEPLYDGPRKLSVAWKMRVSDMRGKITAHGLLRAIKAEARRAKRTSMAAEPSNDIDELAAQLQMLTIDLSGNSKNT